MNSLAKGLARPRPAHLAFFGSALFAACTPGGGGGGATADCVAFPNAPACVNVTHPPADVTTTDTETSDETTSCTPDCAGKMCGPNGCGGFCGPGCNAEGTTCVAGACVAGECGQGGVTASGQLLVGGGIDFDKATITVEHKMDIDEFEDGCLTSVVIELGKGFGCTLHVEAGTATAPAGGLRITKLTFAADSQCPGFPDESEGQYVDFSKMKVLSVVSDLEKIADKNAPSSCITTNFVVHLEGVLADGGGKTLNVGPTSIRVSGEMKSTGSTTASCPCKAACSGKACGDDGCGFDCGVCNVNAECNGAGQCVCVPQCEDGQECGDDGCGGQCGTCGEFETCSEGACIACTPQCDGKACGDNGCGGQCGTCEGNETCNAGGQCTCGNATCGGVCCGATDVCQGGACCTPQCSGKECGADSCGGVCGNCEPDETCGAGGKCTCTPQCDDKQCGNNGCGGQCGSCTGGKSCDATGQCVDPNACAGNGFTAAEEIATDNTTYFDYQAITATSGNFNALIVQVYQNSQGAYPIEAQAAYNIPGGDWQTCPLCVLLMTGCTQATSCDNAKMYFATEGTLTVVAFDPTAPGTFEAVITDAKLKEVTITGGESTFVPGGSTWCMEDQVFMGPLAVGAP